MADYTGLIAAVQIGAVLQAVVGVGGTGMAVAVVCKGVKYIVEAVEFPAWARTREDRTLYVEAIQGAALGSRPLERPAFMTEKDYAKLSDLVGQRDAARSIADSHLLERGRDETYEGWRSMARKISGEIVEFNARGLR